MRIAALVVTWNGEAWIEACLGSISAQDPCPGLVLFDNGSTDRTVEIADSFRSGFKDRGAAFSLIQAPTNTGFPSGANSGIRTLLERGDQVDAVLLLNQDAALEPGCIGSFADELTRHPEAACLGAKNLYPDSGLIQHAGGYLTRPRMVGRHHGHNQPDAAGAHDLTREVQFVTGSSMVIRLSAIAESCLFNEVFSPGYYEDVELCERLRDGGWKVLYTPSARVLHHESASFSDESERLRLAHRNRFIYLLPKLADRDFEREFETAEIEFLERESSFDEARAVNGAALDLLLDLDSLSHRRFGDSEPSPEALDAVRRVMLSVRASFLDLAYSPDGMPTRG